MRIRTSLLLVGAAVLVPGLIASGFAVERLRDQERSARLRALTEMVRATALLVDGEVQRSIGALTALGTSEHLQSGNLLAFYKQAEAVNQPPDVWTLLLDDTGKQLLNTAVPFGTPAPPAQARERVAKAIATGKLFVSDLIRGPVTGKLLTTFYMPVQVANGKQMVVAQAFAADHWNKTAMDSRGQGNWLIAVMDRQGNFIARNVRTKEMLGKSARPELVEAARLSHDGLIRHRTHEGTESYDAFTHSKLTGWTIAVAAPVTEIEASATQAVAWLAAGLIAAIGMATIAAVVLGRRFIQAIDGASAAARAVGRGEAPEVDRNSFEEVGVLNAALAEVGQTLRQETASRREAEAQREQLLLSETAARKAAEEMNASKDGFMALLAHELRNPLASISGATAVLRKRAPTPIQLERFTAIIDRQNRHLVRIVDDLLDVTRMLSGKVSLTCQRLDLAEAVRSCVEAISNTEQAANCRLVVHAEATWVEADVVRLEQIVNNIVGNAIKHSPEGSEVVIEVRPAGGTAVLTVTDYGAGIDAVLLPKIFDPFVQGPPLPGRMASGLGIGLALVRQLVLLHGGQVRANSGGAGAGSRFEVRLPLAEASASPPKRDAAQTRPLLSRVLLVEDNEDARETTATMLRMAGCTVLEAGDAVQALQLATTSDIDAAVVDIGLPGADGYAIARQLRAVPQLAGLRLVALTGYGLPADRQAASMAGFDWHLTKPVDPDALLKAISPSSLT